MNKKWEEIPKEDVPKHSTIQIATFHYAREDNQVFLIPIFDDPKPIAGGELDTEGGFERSETRLALVTLIRILERPMSKRMDNFSSNEIKLFEGAKKILAKYQRPEDILR